MNITKLDITEVSDLRCNNLSSRGFVVLGEFILDPNGQLFRKKDATPARLVEDFEDDFDFPALGRDIQQWMVFC